MSEILTTNGMSKSEATRAIRQKNDLHDKDMRQKSLKIHSHANERFVFVFPFGVVRDYSWFVIPDEISRLWNAIVNSTYVVIRTPIVDLD